MAETSWFVGSVQLEAGNIEVNGVNVAIAAGTYYLRHATAALSLIDLFEDAVQSEEPTATAFITEGRTVRLLMDGANAVAIDWLSNTALRGLLGFTANLASSTAAHDAPNVSALLWSPGWIATPETLLGTAGWVDTDQTRHVSADGTRVLFSTYYEQTQQNLSWANILAERMRVAAGLDGGGTFHRFYEEVLKLGMSIRYYEQLDEVAGSTTAQTWDDTADNSFGPYVIRDADPRWYRRVIDNADLYAVLDLPLMQIAEYT